MNYFELFEIPVTLTVDPSALKNKFFALSKKYHPDYFSAADEETQANALENSALLNKAWKTFQSRDATIQYVLEEKNLLEKEEKYELPADFLMEVLEINESLMDDESSRNPELLIQVDKLEDDIYEPVKAIIENYRDGVTTDEELLKVKEYYYKKKYLDRIRRQLSEMR
jgi:molecular chaperone HscB